MRTTSSARLPIVTDADVVEVRRRSRELAVARGFDPFATAAVTTAASELSRNVFAHGGGGYALLEGVEDATDRAGLRMVFVDEGPGITDLDRALAGGYSTGRSLGLGLSGSRRLVDEFRIHTEAGRGTTVEVVKWARFRR